MPRHLWWNVFYDVWSDYQSIVDDYPCDTVHNECIHLAKISYILKLYQLWTCHSTIGQKELETQSIASDTKTSLMANVNKMIENGDGIPIIYFISRVLYNIIQSPKKDVYRQLDVNQIRLRTYPYGIVTMDILKCCGFESIQYKQNPYLLLRPQKEDNDVKTITRYGDLINDALLDIPLLDLASGLKDFSINGIMSDYKHVIKEHSSDNAPTFDIFAEVIACSGICEPKECVIFARWTQNDQDFATSGDQVQSEKFMQLLDKIHVFMYHNHRYSSDISSSPKKLEPEIQELITRIKQFSNKAAANKFIQYLLDQEFDSLDVIYDDIEDESMSIIFDELWEEKLFFVQFKEVVVELYNVKFVVNDIEISGKLIRSTRTQIKEEISDTLNYIDKSTILQLDREYNDGKTRILNCDFHAKYENGQPLYCVALRNKKSIKNNWIMRDRLFTATEINKIYKLRHSQLPKSTRNEPEFVSALNDLNEIKGMIQRKTDDIKYTKWHKIAVFKSTHNKRRITLSMTKPEFIKDFMQNDSKSVVLPAVVFDKDNKYRIEYIQIVRINKNIDIGVSYQYDKMHNKIKAVGIYVDKGCILNLHQLAIPNHSCHCLDTFASNIHNLEIGNIEDELNYTKYYSGRCLRFTGFINDSIQFVGNQALNAANMSLFKLNVWLKAARNIITNNQKNISLPIAKKEKEKASLIKKLESINYFYYQQTLTNPLQPIIPHQEHKAPHIIIHIDEHGIMTEI